jgi:hypothetical protein
LDLEILVLNFRPALLDFKIWISGIVFDYTNWFFRISGGLDRMHAIGGTISTPFDTPPLRSGYSGWGERDIAHTPRLPGFTLSYVASFDIMRIEIN